MFSKNTQMLPPKDEQKVFFLLWYLEAFFIFELLLVFSH